MAEEGQTPSIIRIFATVPPGKADAVRSPDGVRAPQRSEQAVPDGEYHPEVGIEVF